MIPAAEEVSRLCPATDGTLTKNRVVWWSTAHTYKNAVTNELFLFTSSEMYRRFGGSQYLANAMKV